MTAAVGVGGASVLAGSAAAAECRLAIYSEGGRGQYEIVIDDGSIEKTDHEFYDDDTEDLGDKTRVSGQVTDGWSGSNKDVYIYQGSCDDSDLTIDQLDSNVNYRWE
ncbi:hypothetical protein [Natrinema sp. SYSU A 869]|uniref:hypothetical protein n=1 Tax=Natrinema sp. SYSU A 869 TaxID=2871694 RepID=UPI001CA3A555|nr:hypothetical protein [Natrinema sp. SYSU A 869]